MNLTELLTTDPTGTKRRFLAMLAGSIVVLFHSKLGLDVSPDDVTKLLVFLGGYITQSAAKSIHAAQMAGADAADAVVTPADAVKVLATEPVKP